MEISVVIPTYNEEHNVKVLTSKLIKVLDNITQDYEIIFVDDGSTDRTYTNLLKMHKQNKKIKIIRFSRNFGQTAAMAAGFHHSKGKKVITIDADLQNDPADIPKLLKKLNKGYDAVSGWRYNRKDSLSKKIFSRIAFFLRKILTQEKLHDLGCTLKVYNSYCLKNLNIYGEMHRFIPTLLRWKGYRTAEVKVSHYKRKYGKTKYSMARVVRGFLDLISADFWSKYSTRPFHFFAILGFFFLLIGGGAVSYGLLKNILFYNKFSVGPLLLPAVLFILSGIQFVLFGLFSEMQIRHYYSDKPDEIYNIKKIVK
ncbi:MAG: Glycosyltransferase AglD [Candidatus Woesearchaeota archaeon]|nr:Glycosyltransferase AglD [Candidatus Woesearchaeota archaeon]